MESSLQFEAPVNTSYQQMSSFNSSNDENINSVVSGEFRMSLLSSEVKALYGMFLVLVIILGILGNSLILAVNYRIIRKTTIDVFISGLGIMDVIACIFIVPIRLLELTVNVWSIYTYESIMCKITRYIAHAIVSSSVFVLCLIAVERYQKICRNKSFIEYESSAKKSLAKLIIVALILTFPSFYYHHLSKDEDQCVLDLKNQFLRIYMFSFCILFILLFILVLSLYCLIAQRIHRHTKVFDTNISVKAKSSNNFNNDSVQTQSNALDYTKCATRTDSPETSLPDSKHKKCINYGSDIKYNCGKPKRHTSSNIEQSMLSIISLRHHENTNEIKEHTTATCEGMEELCKDDDKTLKNTPNRRRVNNHHLTVLFGSHNTSIEATTSPCQIGRKRSSARINLSSKLYDRNVHLRLKATRILITVTAVFFISWTPPWIAMFVGYLGTENTKLKLYPVLLFAMRSHFISFFINPILYSLMNRRFRLQAKQLFTALWKRLT